MRPLKTTCCSHCVSPPPPSVEHGGVGMLKPGVQKCKCLLSLIYDNTHYLDGKFIDEE